MAYIFSNKIDGLSLKHFSLIESFIWWSFESTNIAANCIAVYFLYMTHTFNSQKICVSLCVGTSQYVCNSIFSITRALRNNTHRWTYTISFFIIIQTAISIRVTILLWNNSAAATYSGSLLFIVWQKRFIFILLVTLVKWCLRQPHSKILSCSHQYKLSTPINIILLYVKKKNMSS